ncbi:MAG TPA: hypothetical protein VH092_13555 [Urbifossiella sp.]|jgi:hypothetical protein|nr:hypothetical protein [Urbifossiella sp.]
MAVWKVLLIGALASLCLALTFATVAIPIAQDGGQRRVWAGGLLAATAAAGTLLALFLRYAGGSLDVKPRWAARR